MRRLPDSPKDPQDNLLFRQFINERAQNNKDFALACLLKAQDGPDGRIWWSDTFVRTLDPRIRGGSSQIDLVTFPKQERFIRFIHDKISKGLPWGSRKSRGFGLTWAVVIEFAGLWLLSQDPVHLLIASREEAAVDSSKNPDAIMRKLDFLIDGLPQWQKDILIPGYEPRMGTKYRGFKGMEHPLTKSTTIGESTKGNLARGGRKTAGFVDEAAAIAFLMDVIASVSEVTDSMGYISTDLGLATDFARLWSNPDKPIEFFENGCDWVSNPMWLGYWADPAGNPLSIHTDPQEVPERVFVTGETYQCVKGECPVHDEGDKPHSTRYNAACKKVNFDKRKIAEEYDMEAARSGGAVFNPFRIKNAMEYVRSHLRSGELKVVNYRLELIAQPGPAIIDEAALYRQRALWPVRALKMDGGPLRVWAEPFSCRDFSCICKGTGMHVYVIGADTSSGYATSDGAGAIVWDGTIGAFVALLHSNFDSTELGKQVVMLAKYYGKDSGDDINAWCAIESNQEGATVNRIVSQHGILVHQSRSEDKKKARFENRRGVVVSDTNRNAMLAENLEALINGAEGDYPNFFCPFPELFEQCSTFIEVSPAKHSILKPSKTKKAAQGKSKDDIVWMANHAIYGCRKRYGAAIGVLRPDYMRLGPTKYKLQNYAAVG